DGAGGRRGPNFGGLRGRPKNALHGRGHRIPKTVPLENRLRALTPRRVQGRRAGADVVDRIPDDIRQDETDHRRAAGRGSLGESTSFDLRKALADLIDVSNGEPATEQFDGRRPQVIEGGRGRREQGGRTARGEDQKEVPRSEPV